MSATTSYGLAGVSHSRARPLREAGSFAAPGHGVRGRRAAGRHPRCRMRSCWRPFDDLARSRQRAARSTRGCPRSPGRVACDAWAALAPPRATPKAHDGTSTSGDVGPDGVRVFTAEDGWVAFAAVDHGAWAGQGGEPSPSSRSRKGSDDSTARSRRTWPAGWRCGWITAASICRTTSSISSGTGASTPASVSLKSRKPTASSSAGIARSRSKPSTAGLSKPRRGARGRRCVRRTLQPVLAPRKASVSHAARSARAIRATPCRVAQTLRLLSLYKLRHLLLPPQLDKPHYKTRA